MGRPLRLLALAAAMAGCAAAPVFKYAANAPRLSPVETAEVVDRPPIGARLLGTAEVQSSVYELPEDCQAAALREAKLAGATHVVIRGAIPGTASKGPRCRVEGFYMPANR
jgi:hypothetical protein